MFWFTIAFYRDPFGPFFSSLEKSSLILSNGLCFFNFVCYLRFEVANYGGGGWFLVFWVNDN